MDKIETKNFLEQIIEKDIQEKPRVHTRFPPEPNGYLHIGHAKSICLNFGLAAQYDGKCNLRFDDTNPEKEDVEYVDSIKEDIKWLGFDWEDREYYASDYFEQLYAWAVKIIKAGNAYVCDLTQEEIAAKRGTPSKPGEESPFRNRSVEENLSLFQQMREGVFNNGEKSLRAKIDMASPNMHMRDPIMYRIKHVAHHRTANNWCIYPMYDFTHGQSDFIENITHSFCTLEFEVHRPLYDWYLDQIAEPGQERPKQREFARLNLNYTVMSKRLLLELVNQKYVSGWDDPRMPTICGLRRRGYTPASIKNFSERVGVAKRENVIDMGLLEFCVREDLNRTAQRVMAVLNPLKVVVTNWDEQKTDWLEAVNNPEDDTMGVREVPFTRTFFIEQEDFMEDAPKKFFRLAPGREVRLRYAYLFTCNEVIKDENGKVTELRGTIDPESRGGNTPDGRKVKGTIHWVSADHAVEACVNLYDRLFQQENPYDLPPGGHFTDTLNPDSLKEVSALLEPSLKTAKPMERFQFERLGYFCVDKASRTDQLVFNRTVTLRDSWARMSGK